MSDYQQRQESLKRRRMIADMMMKNAQGNGGYSNAWTVGSGVLSAFLGARENRKIDDEYEEIARQMGADRDKALQELMTNPYAPDIPAAPATSSDEGPTRAPVAKKGGFNLAAAQRAIDAGADPQLVMQMMKGKGNQASIYGAVQPDKFTAESLRKFEQSGEYGDLVLRTPNLAVGKFNPGDFTPESMAQFIESRDPNVLVRYAKPEIKDVAGGIESIIPGTKPGMAPSRTPISSPSAERDAAAALARSKAVATAQGEAQGAQDAKAPILQSFGAASTNMRDSISKTQQGGFMGATGVMAPAFDKENSDLFKSRIQQLSAEIRAIFRIPGEGSLSDQEQAQYGLQLPKITNERKTNEQIMNDLEQRVKLRLQSPVGGSQAAPQGEITATGPNGQKIVLRNGQWVPL